MRPWGGGPGPLCRPALRKQNTPAESKGPQGLPGPSTLSRGSDVRERFPAHPQLRCPLVGKVSLLGWGGRDTRVCNPTLQGCSDTTFQMRQQGGNQIPSPSPAGQPWALSDDTAQGRARLAPPVGRPTSPQPRLPGSGSLLEARGDPASSAAANPTQPGTLQTHAARQAAGHTGPALTGSCRHWAPLLGPPLAAAPVASALDPWDGRPH